MRIIGIGGQPATGKSTLMTAIMERLKISRTEPNRIKYVKWHENMLGTTAVLGDYGPTATTFTGTDKLGMSAQPHVVRWISTLSNASLLRTVLFEGDRLFNLSFLQSMEAAGYHCEWYVLTAEPDSIHDRHRARGDSQTETWLKGRKTKVANIMQASQEGTLKSTMTPLPHNTPVDTERNTRTVIATID